MKPPVLTMLENINASIADVMEQARDAETAVKLKTARNITLSGDASGSISFDGSANVTLPVTVEDDSHSHVIDNVDDLQAALNAKAPLASPALTGTPTAPTAVAGTNSTQLATTEFVTTAVASKTSVTGNAGTATKLATARTITLSGDATGTVTFDGSANATLSVAVKDDSHNHTIANVDNLQAALDGKADSTHTHAVQTTITGNAATATKLATARTITLTGDASGATEFDGSANKAIAVTVSQAANAAKVGGKTIYTSSAAPTDAGQANGDIFFQFLA